MKNGDCFAAFYHDVKSGAVQLRKSLGQRYWR